MKMNRALRIVLQSLVLATCVPTIGCSQPPAQLIVKPDELHQTMAGWEVTARTWEFDKVNDRFDGAAAAQREKLASMVVNEVGIDRLRLEIKSGIENPVDYWALFVAGKMGYREYKAHFYEKVNDNDDPTTLDPAGVQFTDLDWRVENVVLPIKRQLEARGRRLWLNFAYGDFRWTELRGTLSHARNPAEYAELVVAAFTHLRTKYGLVPDSLEMIVEPDNTNEWNGVVIGRAIVAVSDRLAAAGFPGVKIIAPSTAKARRALSYFEDIKSVPGAASRMSTLAYHRYEGEPDTLDLNEIRDAARASRMQTAMSEYVDGDMTDLISDLNDADVSSWQSYGIAARIPWEQPARPGTLLSARGPAGVQPVLSVAPLTRAMALIFNNVDQGSRRIGVYGNNRDVTGTGFLTPQGKLVVVGHATAAQSVSVSGLRPGPYSLSIVGSGGKTSTRTILVRSSGALNLRVAAGSTFALVARQASGLARPRG